AAAQGALATQQDTCRAGSSRSRRAPVRADLAARARGGAVAARGAGADPAAHGVPATRGRRGRGLAREDALARADRSTVSLARVDRLVATRGRAAVRRWRSPG